MLGKYDALVPSIFDILMLMRVGSWKMLEANLFLLDQSMTVSGSAFCSTIQPDLASTLFSAIEYALKNGNNECLSCVFEHH